MKSSVSALLVLSLAASAAQAIPIVSAGSGLWTNPAAWNPAQVPTAADSVTILEGHTNTINDAVVHEVASLTIQTNGALTHMTNSTEALGERYKVILSIAGNLTIDAGGQINADGRGYRGNEGPGNPLNYGTAGHGGCGKG